MLQTVGRIGSSAARVACLTALGAIRALVPDRIGRCRFTPSCSQYALESLRVLPVNVAIGRILMRVGRCNPIFAGGYDPVVGKSAKEQIRE